MHWVWFFFGQLVNVLRQANLVAGCRPDKNKVGSVKHFIYRNFYGLLVRLSLAIGAWAALNQTNLGGVLITKVAGAEWVPNIPIHQIPVLGLPFGIIFDLGFDWAIEKSGWLKSRIPPLTGQTVIAPQSPFRKDNGRGAE